jgi:hypothetical protein
VLADQLDGTSQTSRSWFSRPSRTPQKRPEANADNDNAREEPLACRCTGAGDKCRVVRDARPAQIAYSSDRPDELMSCARCRKTNPINNQAVLNGKRERRILFGIQISRYHRLPFC